MIITRGSVVDDLVCIRMVDVDTSGRVILAEIVGDGVVVAGTNDMYSHVIVLNGVIGEGVIGAVFVDIHT